MINLKKKYWLIIVFSLITIIIVLASFYLKQKYSLPSASPAPVEPSPFSWQGIEPGKTSEAELKQKLSQPLEEGQTEKGKLIEYSSPYESYPNQVYLKDKTVFLIKEQVDYQKNLNLSSFINQYGQPELIKYEKNLGNTYPLNIFPSYGVAVAAHLSTGRIIEIWYFQPMSKSDFSANFGSDLSSQPFQRF